MRERRGRDFWITVAPAVLLVIAAFAVATIFVKPAPPKHLLIAIAGDEGGSRYFARRCYAEGLSKAEVTRVVGGSDGLASERRYVWSTLPGGIRRELAGGGVEAVGLT